MANKIMLHKRIQKYAYIDVDKLFQELGVTDEGLSDNQIETMSKKYGSNRLVRQVNDTLLYRLRRAFVNPFCIILFCIAITSLITDVLTSHYKNNLSTITIIFIMILSSGTIRLIQELRAKNTADKLEKFIDTKVTVKRDNSLIEIPAEELVVGDIIFISAGDRIPADIRLIQTTDLFISQAAITGESAILEKNSRTKTYVEQEILTQFENLAFMGSLVISGKGQGIVLAVGNETLYGSFIKSDASIKNSFEQGASSISFVILRFMLIMVPIVFMILGLVKGKWLESFTFALSVAVGLTPEMLPMVITTCLAKGSLVMSKKKTIVKDINAMQGFGSMDVLCMDKTGTLTHESILLEYYMDILGNESETVLDFAYLNSSYHSGIYNPIDNAILACKTMPGKEGHFIELLNQYQKIDEIPFDYNRKFVSTLVEKINGERQLIIKGDVKQVFLRCHYIEYDGQLHKIDKNSFSNVSIVVNEMLEDGMKVIAVARKDMEHKQELSSSEECNMILMGYVAFFDAPKQTAKQAISLLKRLNVTPKVLTGDQSIIASSICRRVGISTDLILTGTQIDEMTDEQLQLSVEKTSLFAELTPSHKVRLVSIMHKNGHTVGFLGDGINDIPALTEANVGISVNTAVDAAKDASDVVLLEKDLNVLEQGILEGRKTFVNMLKYIKITASSNFGNILSIVCASAFLPFLPMTALQLLLLNLLYDTLCIVLPWDNVDIEETMFPREWSGKTLGRFMVSFGTISSLFDIVTFLFLYFFLCPSVCNGLTYSQISDPTLQLQFASLFQTGWFLESMWTQALILHFLRTTKIPLLQSRPSNVVWIITIIGIVAYTGLTFTKSAGLLGLTKLPTWYFLFLLVMVIIYTILTTIIKYFYQKKYQELL